MHRRLAERLRETSSHLWPTAAQRKQVADRVTQGYRADKRKRRWLLQEQADLYVGDPVYIVHRALTMAFRDPVKERAEAVRDALDFVERDVVEHTAS